MKYLVEKLNNIFLLFMLVIFCLTPLLQGCATSAGSRGTNSYWTDHTQISNYPNAPYAMEDGKKMYVAKAINPGNNYYLGGKWRTDWNEASTAFLGKENWLSNFSICRNGKWLPITNGTASLPIGNNAIKSGQEGTITTYAVRITSNTYGQQIGKYHPDRKQIFFSYAGKELSTDKGDVSRLSGEQIKVELLVK